MFEIGRVCLKIAGRDAGKYCIIIDVLDKNLVVIDGQTRRRKCNLLHLEPTNDLVKLSKGASNSEVVKALKNLKLDAEEKSDKEKKPSTVRQKKQKKSNKDKAAPADKKQKK